MIPDDEYVPGIDQWKKSACGMCAAGCGIAVRTREHKANKIEGVADHPVNSGALCARGQAALQLLYNPDRIRGPMKRSGERGSGGFQPVGWEEAIAILAGKLSDAKARPGSVVFVTNRPHGVDAVAAEALLAACESNRLVAHRSSNEPLTETAYERGYGVSGIPYFDVANATYLISFGARFLETWHSPVMYSLGYGEFRSPAGRGRGKFVHVEPRMSLTAGNADEWVPAAPGSEGLLALAIAQVITREGKARSDVKPSFLAGSLDEFAPETVADRIGISAERIIRIARDFAGAERPLVIAGGAAVACLEPAAFLNRLVDNLGKPGGVFITNAARLDPFAELRAARPARAPWSLSLGDDQLKGAEALLIHGTNPVFLDPAMEEKLKAVPFLASFSHFLDETALIADLVLPDHTFLESWDLVAAFPAGPKQAVTLAAPVVKPEFDSRQTADTLIAALRAVDESAALPFESAEEAVHKAAAGLRKRNGSISAESDDEFWTSLTESSFWSSADFEPEAKARPPSGAALPATQPEPRPIVEEPFSPEFPLKLLVFEHAALGFGEHANLPALQELPDTMTAVIWGSWVEINPKTASGAGIADGDLVEVRTAYGSVRAPAVLYPAIHPDVIAIPGGQGHTSHGSYASNRGANIATLFQPGDSLPQPGMTAARVTKIGGGAQLVRFGTMIEERPHTER
jgi:anaerobic selenocysteine-containing dehydrogenase